MSVLKFVTLPGNNLCSCCSFLPQGGAKPVVRIILNLNSLPMFGWVSFHMLSNKAISLCPLLLQAKQQQLHRSRLGQDGRAVAEGKGSRGQKEISEDDATTVTQPYDREHTHVNHWRRHTPAGWNGPIGDKGGRCCTPPHTQLCPFVLLLHPDNPLPFLSPSAPSSPWLFMFSPSPHDIVAAVFTLVSPSPYLVFPSTHQMFHNLTSSHLMLWLHSILYSQNNTVYIIQNVSRMT